MKQYSRQKEGYILLLSTIILSATIAVVTYMFTRGATYMPFMHTMIQRQKAKKLAFGGIQVAIAQLAQAGEPEKDVEKKNVVQEGKEPQKEQDKSTPDQQAKDFLAHVLPTLNKWQTFDLIEDIDGVDGTLRICVMCEQGKININKIYDFKKKKFRGEGQVKGDWKKVLESLFKTMQELVGGVELLPAFEKFLKERKYEVLDVTELLTVKEFAVFKNTQFFEPLDTHKMGEKSGKQKRPLYLTDIFTVYSSKPTVQPWLFSDSLIGLLGMQRINFGEKKDGKNKLQDLLKSFKKRANWSQDWDVMLKPVYGKELHSLPKGIESVFDNVFDPKNFSILVHATVGDITQRLFVIAERKKSVQNESASYDVNIKKLYWL